LDAKERRPDLEDQVITPAFDKRPVNTNTELDRSVDDRGLRDRTLLVGGEHV
jgi:hypothetical protein